MPINQYLGSNPLTKYHPDPFQRLCERIRVEQDWHAQVFATDPPCLPDQWRMWDRTEVEAIIFLKQDVLKSCHDMCHDFLNRRFRLRAIEAELTHQRVVFTPLRHITFVNMPTPL